MDLDAIDKRGLGWTIFDLTWPMLFGTLALMSYQLVDAAWIALLGVEPLAALGFTVPMQQLVTGFQVGLGIATTAVISRTLGRDEPELARRQAGVVVVSGALIIATLLLSLWLARPWILQAMGATGNVQALVREFWSVWLFSAWAGAMAYFGYSIHRAQGDTRFPGFAMLTASVINMVLDPIFIFVLDWGLRGAAVATLVAFSTGCALAYPRVIRKGWIRISGSMAFMINQVRQIGQTAAPAMLSQLMPPLSATLATGLVAGFGSAAVAGWALGTRLEFFSIVVVLALTMSLPPLIGRFAGREDWDSIERTVRLVLTFVLVWQLILALIWLLLSPVLVPLVSDNNATADVLRAYLIRVPFSYPALGVCMLMVSLSNALGLPFRALLISLMRLFLCYLPCLWLGARLGDLNGLLTGALVGNLLAGALAYQFFRLGMQGLRAG